MLWGHSWGGSCSGPSWGNGLWPPVETSRLPAGCCASVWGTLVWWGKAADLSQRPGFDAPLLPHMQPWGDRGALTALSAPGLWVSSRQMPKAAVFAHFLGMLWESEAAGRSLASRTEAGEAGPVPPQAGPQGRCGGPCSRRGPVGL